MKSHLIFYSLCVFFLFFRIDSSAQTVTEAQFKAEADSAGLSFTMPKGYKATVVKENRDLYYSFAIINADSSMEVRYSIWPLKKLKEEYEKSLTDSNSVMVHHNKIIFGRAQANNLNMTGGEMIQIGGFPPEAVKKEFNADMGGSSFFEFNCEFGKGWKYGQAMYLHKDDVADVVVTFMSNDMDKHPDLMLIAFHALVFK